MKQSIDARVLVGIAAFLGMVVSSPAISSINPLLLKPTIAEFGWNRATISSAYLVAAPIMAVLYIFVGPALDRFGVRRLLMIGYVLFGAATALLSQLNGSLVQLLALKVVVTSFATLPTGVAFGKVISAYFTARRGTMLGFCLGGGGGMGMMIMPLIAAAVLEHEGWRATYVAIGLICAVVGLTATALLPADRPAVPEGQKAAPQFGIEGRIAWKSRTFLILIASTMLSCMVLNGTVAHLAAIMTDVGMTNTEAAVALSVYAMAMVTGQFGIGLVLDRIQGPRIAIPILIVAMTGLALLYQSSGKTGAIMGAACIGLSAGSEYGLLPYMVTRYFGLRSFGQLYGLIYAAAALGTGFGPFAMGAAYDFGGSYERALLAFGIAIAVVIVLMSRLPTYAFTADGSVPRPADAGAEDPAADPALETSRPRTAP